MMWDENRKPLYPRHLQGFATNRWGGHALQREVGFKGAKYGAASRVRHLSPQEKKKIEESLRKRGILPEFPEKRK